MTRTGTWCRFRAEGATNVSWVFHMVQWFQPNHPWESFANYYPGNDYVDWLALSLFGLNTQPDGSLTSFEGSLATFHASDYPGVYNDITSLGDKPLSLMDVGVVPLQGDAAGWVDGMFSSLRSGKYPRVAMMSWFDSDDWGSKLVTGTPLQAAFKAGATTSLFAAAPVVSGTCVPTGPTVKVRGSRVTWTAVRTRRSTRSRGTGGALRSRRARRTRAERRSTRCGP